MHNLENTLLTVIGKSDSLNRVHCQAEQQYPFWFPVSYQNYFHKYLSELD